MNLQRMPIMIKSASADSGANDQCARPVSLRDPSLKMEDETDDGTLSCCEPKRIINRL